MTQSDSSARSSILKKSDTARDISRVTTAACCHGLGGLTNEDQPRQGNAGSPGLDNGASTLPAAGLLTIGLLGLRIKEMN